MVRGRILLYFVITASFCLYAQTIYEQAASLIQNGDAASAAHVLESRLQESPGDLKALTLMGMSLAAQGRREEGNVFFSRALDVNPGYGPAVRSLALNYLSMNKPDEARSNFERLVKIAPADPSGYLGLAQAWVALGRRQEAARALDGLPRASDAGAHFAAGNLFAGIGRYDGAVREFELAQDGYPDAYDAGYNLILAYVKTGQYPKAQKTGEGLLARGFRKPELYNVMALAYEGQGNTPEAYAALRTATTLDPSEGGNYLDLIALCLTHRNYDLALEIADIAVARLPASDRLRLQHGIVLAMKENFEGARADFDAARKLAPDATLPTVAVGLMLLQMDRPEEAVKLLRTRAQTRPDYLTLWFLGEALNRTSAAAGGPEENEAIDALTRSVASNPDVAPSRILLAKLLARRGELDTAQKNLERALELDPGNVSATYQLAQICRKKGETVRAKELFAKVSKAKNDDREQFTRGGLQQIIRAGSQ
jgi:cellulose synthase operon protein C